ncbi:hypothetical protein ABE501_05415 [Comamonas testosteroni]
MPDDKTTNTNKPARQLTAALVAKCVQRTLIEMVDGKGKDDKPAKVPRPKQVPVTEDEVLSFKDYGTHVVVVTRDGQKLTGTIKAE